MLPPWGPEPNQSLFPKHPGDHSEVHHPGLEGLRWRLNRRIEYAYVPDELKASGKDGYLGEYRGKAIFLRNDLDYNDESMALCHELMHVVLHPEQGDSSAMADPEYHREERIVNAACVSICKELGIGDYMEFASRWGLADLDEPEHAGDRALVREIVEAVTCSVSELEPQADDRLFREMKLSQLITIEPGPPRL